MIKVFTIYKEWQSYTDKTPGLHINIETVFLDETYTSVVIFTLHLLLYLHLPLLLILSSSSSSPSAPE